MKNKMVNVQDLQDVEVVESKIDKRMKKLYFFKMSEKFFEDARIRAIKEIPGGYEYLVLYFEMMALSLRNGGYIEKTQGINELTHDLSLKIPGYNKTTVETALMLYLGFGLIETDRETYCEMLQVPELTYSETMWAGEKREQRTKKKEIEGKKEREKEIEETFERLWKLYPKKRGKGQVSKRAKADIYQEIGEEQFKRAIGRYVQELKANGTPELFIKMGSTFFNSGYMDYLDKEYTAAPRLATFQEPTAIANNTNRTDQVLEDIMTNDNVFTADGLQKRNFKKEKFSPQELERIYNDYPQLR